jgi:hypothetical protein
MVEVLIASYSLWWIEKEKQKDGQKEETNEQPA